MFGSFPHSYMDIADEERMGIIENHINKYGLWKPFSLAEDAELSEKNRTIICKSMRMDPRDRPSAKELLRDPWSD